ncbi:hypothetical protein Tco_0104450 [Tanacetum coccineum]
MTGSGEGVVVQYFLGHWYWIVGDLSVWGRCAAWGDWWREGWGHVGRVGYWASGVLCGVGEYGRVSGVLREGNVRGGPSGVGWLLSGGRWVIGKLCFEVVCLLPLAFLLCGVLCLWVLKRVRGRCGGLQQGLNNVVEVRVLCLSLWDRGVLGILRACQLWQRCTLLTVSLDTSYRERLSVIAVTAFAASSLLASPQRAQTPSRENSKFNAVVITHLILSMYPA